MRSRLSFSTAIVLAAALSACGGGAKVCTSNAECAADETCVGIPQLPAGTCQKGTPSDGGPVADGGRTDGGPVADGGRTDGGPVADGGRADGGPADAGPDPVDGGPADAGPQPDAGPDDAGAPPVDGGPTADGGPVADGGPLADGGASDGGVIAAGGDTCADAPTLASGTYTGLTTVGFAANLNPPSTCAGFAQTGPDRVFQVRVPSGNRIRASVTPTLTGYDPGIYLVPAPASNCDFTAASDGGAATGVCLVGDDSGLAAATNTVSYENSGGAEQTLFVVIDSNAPTGTGTFDLVIDIATPPAGDSCATAQTLVAGTPLTGQTTVGLANDYTGGTGCSTSGAGPDRVYKIDVPAGQRANVTVTPVAAAGDGGAGFDPSVSLLVGAACSASPRVCVSSANNGAAGQPDTIAWANSGTSAQTLFIVVDSASTTGGEFTVGVAFDTPPAGDSCGTATTIAGTGTLVDQTTVGFSNDYTGGTGCQSSQGVDRVYKVDLQPLQRVRAVVTPKAPSTFDPSINLVVGTPDSCASATRVCASSDDSGDQTSPNTVLYANRTAGVQTAFIIVDTFDPNGVFGDPTGPFDLAVTVEAIPAGEVCENATPLTSGAALTGQTTFDFTNDISGSGTNCAAANSGGDRVYSINVPNGQRLTTTVTPVAGFNTSVSLIAGPAANCAPASGTRSCVASADNGGSGAADTAVYSNTSGGDQLVFVVVDSGATTGGVFSILATVDTPPAEGDRCETAIAVTSGASVNGTTVNFTNDYSAGTNCASSTASAGTDVVYKIDVPAGQRLTATLTPTAGFDASLSLVAGPAASCNASPRVCLASAAVAGAGVAETASYLNATTATQTVFMIVDSPAGAGNTFSLQATVGAPPPGDVCASAVTLTANTALMGQTTVGFGNDYTGGTGCSTASGGPDALYKIDVPNNQMVSVAVTPVAGFDPSVSLLVGATACDATPRVCVAGANSAAAGAVETAAYANVSGGVQTIFVVVDSASATGGAFSINATIGALSPGETCNNAEVLVPNGTPVNGTTVGYSSQYNGGATPCGAVSSGGSGPDRVYSIAIPAGQRLTATVAPSGWDASLSLVTSAACAATPLVCLAGADAGSSGGTESVTYTNTGAAEQTVLLIVDGFASTASGTFTVTATVTPPATMLNPGETCAAPVELTTFPVNIEASTTGFANDFTSTGSSGCASLSGPEGVYKISLAAGKRLTVSVNGTTDTFDPSLNLVVGSASCGPPVTCTASNDSGTDRTVNTVTHANAGTTAQDVFIIVDTVDSVGGPFALQATLEDLPPITNPGDTCQTAVPITVGQAVTGTTVGLTGNYATTGNCLAAGGLDGVYSLTVPAGKKLTAVATPQTSFNVSMSLVAGPAANCDASPRACLASIDATSSTSGAETLVYANTTGADQAVFLVIDSTSTTATGSGLFSLTTALEDLPGVVNPSDTCATAPTLTVGQTVTGSTVGLTGNYGTGTNCSGTTGIDGVYAIEIPAGKKLTVVGTPVSAFNLSLNIVAGPAANCDASPRVCLAGADASSATNGAETLVYANATTSPQPTFIVVDTSSSTATGSFTLLATLEDLPPALPPGDTCATAAALTLGQTISGSTVGLTGNYGTGTGCGGTTSIDGVYSVLIPAGKVLTAVATPLTPYNLSLALVAGPASNCDASPRVCLAGVDATSSTSGAETLTYFNAGTTEQAAFLMVDSSSTTAGSGAFTLSTVVADPPAGESCGNAVPIVSTGTITGETTVGFTNNLAPASTCTGFSTNGPDKVYSISVGPGQTLTATVTPTAGGDPSLYLIDSPASNCTAAPTCLVGSDDGGSSEPDTITYANTSGAAKTVFLVIDGFFATGYAYTLTTALAP